MAISSPLFNMFGRSPIRPLQKHMSRVYECAGTLQPFFQAVWDQAWDVAGRQAETINRLEDEADELKKDLRLHLPKSLFLPVSRGDILTLLAMQDRIANKAKDLAGLTMARHFNLPDEAMKSAYMAFLDRCLQTVRQAQKAINELDELLETGFRGNEVSLVEDMIVKLDQIEHDTDEMKSALCFQVAALEVSLPPVDIMFLYKLMDWTSDLADRAQNVGGQFLLLLAR